VVIAQPLCDVLFERGAFGPQDTANTAMALAAYGLGLPAFVFQKVLQPIYYAREDTRRPFNYAVTSMLVNAAIAIGLMPVIGFVAAALATSVSAWVMVWQLWRGSRTLGLAASFDARFRRRGPRILLASLGMGVVLWLMWHFVGPSFDIRGWRFLGLAALVGSGLISYGVLGLALGAFRPADFAALRRQR
jgi:putative peptidoglycan lipid II flippase